MPSGLRMRASVFERDGDLESGRGPGGSSARSFAPADAAAARAEGDAAFARNLRAARRAVGPAFAPGRSPRDVTASGVGSGDERGGGETPAAAAFSRGARGDRRAESADMAIEAGVCAKPRKTRVRASSARVAKCPARRHRKRRHVESRSFFNGRMTGAAVQRADRAITQQ